MKKLLLTLFAVIAAMTCLNAAEELSFDFTKSTELTPPVAKPASSENVNDYVFTNKVVSLELKKGTASTECRLWNSSGTTELRLYTGSKFTISSSSLITKIQFTGTIYATATGLSSNTWTGSSNEVTFSVTKTCKIQKIVVTVEDATKAADPKFSLKAGTYTGTQKVALTCATEGAQIRYTTNGDDPTAESAEYVDSIAVDKSMTLKAKAFAEGLTESEVAEAAYVIKVVNPTIALEAGTYYNTQSVTLACATEGAQIRYTTDGTEPTEGSTLYENSAITVDKSMTLKAKAFKEGLEASEVAEAAYVIAVADPVFTPKAGMYADVQNVTIECETEGASIYYTTDGTTEPTAESTKYEGAIAVTKTTTIKAIAIKGEEKSAVVTANYELAVADPTFTPKGGKYATPQDVTIKCEAEGAQIYYTTNGDEPTAESTKYEGAIAVTKTTTIKAVAIKGELKSNVVTAKYEMVNAYKLVTSADELEAGAKYMIAGMKTGSVSVMGVQNTNNREAVEDVKLESDGTLIPVTDAAILTLGGDATDGWTFFDPVENGYLYAANSSKNYLKTQTTVDKNAQASITIETSGIATIKFKGTYTHNLLQYNSGSTLFSCYLSEQNAVYLYKEIKEEEPECASVEEYNAVEDGKNVTFTCPLTVVYDNYDAEEGYSEHIYVTDGTDVMLLYNDALESDNYAGFGAGDVISAGVKGVKNGAQLNVAFASMVKAEAGSATPVAPTTVKEETGLTTADINKYVILRECVISGNAITNDFYGNSVNMVAFFDGVTLPTVTEGKRYDVTGFVAAAGTASGSKMKAPAAGVVVYPIKVEDVTDTTVGVNDAKGENVTVLAGEGEINVLGEAKSIAVYNASGACISKNEAKVNCGAGLYIVVVDGKVLKVVVR